MNRSQEQTQHRLIKVTTIALCRLTKAISRPCTIGFEWASHSSSNSMTLGSKDMSIGAEPHKTELQEIYDELYEKYKESILKHKKIISDLKFDRDSLYKAHYDLELKMKSMQANQKDLENKNQDSHNLLSKVQDDHLKEVGYLKDSLSKVGNNNFQNPSSSKPNYVKRTFNGYKQRNFHKTSKGKRIRSLWVPKEVITSNNISAIATWIPKGTKAKTSCANSWYLDSGCLRHMTGDKSRFLELKPKNGGVLTFGDNSKGHIEGIGSIGNHSSIFIDNVLYVNGLKHNLLSISQLCDKGSMFCLMLMGKHHRVSFKPINDFYTNRVLQLISMYLFGPIRTIRLGGKSYAFALVDDFSRYTWVLFLSTKDEALEKFITFLKITKNDVGQNISHIRSDHGTEFQNLGSEDFVMKMVLAINFAHLEPLNKMVLLGGKIEL
ncbi:hypothetical protein GQ457_10G011060 [Hibiscus cannabinus]